MYMPNYVSSFRFSNGCCKVCCPLVGPHAAQCYIVESVCTLSVNYCIFPSIVCTQPCSQDSLALLLKLMFKLLIKYWMGTVTIIMQNYFYAIYSIKWTWSHRVGVVKDTDVQIRARGSTYVGNHYFSSLSIIDYVIYILALELCSCFLLIEPPQLPRLDQVLGQSLDLLKPSRQVSPKNQKLVVLQWYRETHHSVTHLSV